MSVSCDCDVLDNVETHFHLVSFMFLYNLNSPTCSCGTMFIFFVKYCLGAILRMSAARSTDGNGAASSVMPGVRMAPPLAGANVQPLVAAVILDAEAGGNGLAGGNGASAANGAGAKPPMWWTNNTSGFVLCRTSQLIKTGARSDKGFKEKDVNQVAKALVRMSPPHRCTTTLGSGGRGEEWLAS